MNDRVRPGMRLGTGVSIVVVAAALVPAAVACALLWPSNAAPVVSVAPVSAPNAPALDLDALVTLAKENAAAPPSVSTPSSSASASALVFDKARVEIARALQKRIAKARDARRAAGAAAADLRKPFTVDELGGAATLKELGVAAGSRYLITRAPLGAPADVKVLAPASAPLPEGVDLASPNRDEDILEADARLGDKPVHLLRRCIAGELLCVLDIVDVASVPASAPATPSGGTATLVAALERARDQSKAASTNAANPANLAPGANTSARMFGAVPLAGVVLLVGALAALLAALAVARLRSVSSSLSAASLRLRAVSAGRSASANAGAVAGEIDDLERAIDEAALAIGDGATRSHTSEIRAARLAAVAAGLERARGRVDQRVPSESTDELAVAAVVNAANALLESFEARVVRWRSHVDVIGARPDASALSELKAELIAMAPAPSAPTTVAALVDMPATEIKSRLDDARES